MFSVTPTSPQGQITLDHLSTTVDGKPMWSPWDIRPFISPEVSDETYVDCVLTVVSVLEYQEGVDHSLVVIRGGNEIDLFDREVFELVCNILDVLPEVRDYFSPSVRERLEKVTQPPTNMAEALRLAADEHERAEQEGSL